MGLARALAPWYDAESFRMRPTNRNQKGKVIA